MLTGDEIRTARERAGWTQAHLGDLVGVSMRSIGNYERGDTIPRNRMPVLEEVLAPYIRSGQGPSLVGASDAQLLAEIARRFAGGARSKEIAHDTAAKTDAGVTPANVKHLPPGPGDFGHGVAAQRDDE